MKEKRQFNQISLVMVSEPRSLKGVLDILIHG